MEEPGESTDARDGTPPARRGARLVARVARRPRASSVLFGMAVLVAGGLVLAAHGFLPGMSQVPLTALFGAGSIQCLRDQGIASLWTWCMSLGMPVGAPRLTGLPEVYLGWLVSYVPGVDAWAAHQLTKGALDLVALAGALALLRRWRINRWIALPAVVAYAVAPNVIVLNGYPYTFIGYLLLPAFWFLALRTLDGFDRARWVPTALVVLGASVFMAFTDGYAFMTAGLVAGVLVARWSWRHARRGRWRRGLGGLAVWLAGLGGAAALYTLWVPEGAYRTDVPLEYFGLLAVDVVTLVVPSAFFGLPGLLGLDAPQLSIWGVGDTPPTHYLGVLVVLLAVGYLVLGRRRRAPVPEDRAAHDDAAGTEPGERGTEPDARGELLALTVAGAVALVLSLGPTLKAGQTAPGLDASLLSLPTTWVYEHVPGFTEMRATSRWLIATRFALLALAAAGLQVLYAALRARTSRARGDRGPRGRVARAAPAVAVGLLAVLAFVEISPNVPRLVHERRWSIALVHEIRDGVVAEADEMLHPGEVVLVLPSVNDFLAMYLVPMSGVRSYNVGGDKNWYLAGASWPADVRAAVDGYGPESADLLCDVLDGEADAIVLPYVDPYAGVLLRRQDPEREAGLRWMADVLSEDERFEASRGTYLTVLRLAADSC